jgi:hypothetical protein
MIQLGLLRQINLRAISIADAEIAKFRGSFVGCRIVESEISRELIEKIQ